MKSKDMISALLGILVMAITYWLLFFHLAPNKNQPAKTFSSVPHVKIFE